MECLRCGQKHDLRNGECPRCGYVGWAPSADLTELERRMLRDRPVEYRGLRAVA